MLTLDDANNPADPHPTRRSTLENERLALRLLHPDDLPALSSFHAETLFWWCPFRRGWTSEETAAFIERTVVARYTEDAFALSAVVLRDAGQFAGWAGLWVPWFLPEILPAVEVGWRLG